MRPNLLSIRLSVFSAFGDISAAKHTMHLPMNRFHRNEEWNLRTPIPLKITEMNERQEIVMELVVSRDPRFYMVLLAFPSSLLMILNSSAFFIPVDSGEKLSFAVTIFFSTDFEFCYLYKYDAG